LAIWISRRMEFRRNTHVCIKMVVRIYGHTRVQLHTNTKAIPRWKDCTCITSEEIPTVIIKAANERLLWLSSRSFSFYDIVVGTFALFSLLLAYKSVMQIISPAVFCRQNKIMSPLPFSIHVVKGDYKINSALLKIDSHTAMCLPPVTSAVFLIPKTFW
jgi:hypothetical protein